jgi:XTP/dITP diphosphohydrolase
MRVTVRQFLHDAARDVVDGERVVGVLLGDPGVEEDLEQNVPQLFEQRLAITLLDGLDQFEGLLDEVLHQRLMGLLDLVAVMDRLRSPGGCPWDAEQTHASLVKYLVEESFELVEAIEEGDREALLEELGDVLLQVFFHARIAEEDPAEPFGIDEVAGGIVEKLTYRHPHVFGDPFTVDDVAAGIIDKLTYRHPHVFGDAHAPTAEHVEDNWERLKAEEKQRSSAVDGVPLAQPALALAAKLHSRAVKAGLTVPLPEADDTDPGTQLLALAIAAQDQGLDPEAELRAAARRYRDAIRQAEKDK